MDQRLKGVPIDATLTPNRSSPVQGCSVRRRLPRCQLTLPRQTGLSFLGTFSDLLTNSEADEIVAEFVRGKIDEVVKDPATADRLKPRGHPIFARRPCLDTNYCEAFNRPNVQLADCLTDPIERLTGHEQGLTELYAPRFCVDRSYGKPVLAGAQARLTRKESSNV